MTHEPQSASEALELFIEMRRRGERVDPAAFAARYPEHGEELGSAIEALLALEDTTLELVRDGTLPERIGAYRVVRQIGRGGMGVVLEAVEEPLGRRVALKILPPEHLSSAVARERFRREAKLASQLEHSGIATIFGAGVDAEEPWIAMRFVEGESLAQKIARARDDDRSSIELDPSASGRDSALRIASVLAGVARALQYAHERGILHRDVKPSNVLITPEGAPVLLDFGLAVGTDSDATLTRTGQTAGTPAYLPPELVSGERAQPDAQGDLYALGVTLYECLTLRRPFEGPTQVALYRAIVSGSASGVRTLNREIPRDLAVVVATAMERDPARRYRSAAALAADLEACAAGRPILARPLPLHGRVARWMRREPKQAVLVSLLLCAVVAIALFGGAWWSSRDRVLAADRMDQDRRFEQDLQDGYADLATRRVDNADKIFAHAQSLRPASIEALVGRAVVRIDDHHDDEAIALLAKAPDSPAMEALRAVARGEKPKLDLGAEWLASASSTELFVDGLRIQKQAERAPRAERKAIFQVSAARFTEAVHRSPGARGFFHIKRAFAARDAGDEAGVRSAAAALSALWPDSARAVFTAGNALSRYDRKESIRLLHRAIELDPSWGPPYQLLGNVHVFASEWREASEVLNEALRRDRSDADAYNTIGLAYDRMNCVDDARAAFEHAISIRPAMFEAWINLAALDYYRKNYIESEPAVRRAIELAPYEPYPHGLLAAVLQRTKRAEESLAEYETTVGFEKCDAANWGGYAATLITLENPEAALRAAEIAMEMNPKEPDHVRLRNLALEQLEKAKAER